MEEKESKKESKKLTYEQLEAYAQQLSVTAEKIYKENQELKDTLERAKEQLRYHGLDLAFKVLEYKECFNKEFVAKIANKLEEMLSPEEDKEDSEK